MPNQNGDRIRLIKAVTLGDGTVIPTGSLGTIISVGLALPKCIIDFDNGPKGITVFNEFFEEVKKL